MRPTTLGRPAWLWAGAVVLLLTGVPGVPSARAEGCAARHGFRPAVLHLDLLAGVSALAPSDDSNSSLPRSPCAGLKCSAGDSMPPPASAPVPTLRAERWGALMGSSSAPEQEASRLSGNEAMVHPVHAGPSLFRPPRG